MNLQLDKAVAEKGPSSFCRWRRHGRASSQGGEESIGNMKVDPGYLVFEPQSCKLDGGIRYFTLSGFTYYVY